MERNLTSFFYSLQILFLRVFLEWKIVLPQEAQRIIRWIYGKIYSTEQNTTCRNIEKLKRRRCFPKNNSLIKINYLIMRQWSTRKSQPLPGLPKYSHGIYVNIRFHTFLEETLLQKRAQVLELNGAGNLKRRMTLSHKIWIPVCTFCWHKRPREKKGENLDG